MEGVTSLESKEMLSWATNFASEPEKAYDALSKRQQRTQQALKQLLTHFQERAHVEEEYAKKFLKLIEGTNFDEEPSQSLAEAENFYKSQLEVMLRTHQQMNLKFSECLIEPLQQFLGNKKLTQKHFDHEYERHLKAVKSSFATMEKKAKEYLSKCKEEVKCNEKVAAATEASGKVTPKDLEKLKDTHKKAKLAVDASEAEYQSSISRFNQFQLSFDNKWAELVETVRVKEEEGLRLTAESLAKISNVQLELYSLYAKNSQRVVENLDFIKPRDDLDSFVSASRTGNLLPERYNFVSFYSAMAKLGRAPAPEELREQYQQTLEEERQKAIKPFDPNTLAGKGASRASLVLQKQESTTNIKREPENVEEDSVSPGQANADSETQANSELNTLQVLDAQDVTTSPETTLQKTPSSRSASSCVPTRGVPVLPVVAGPVQLRKTGSLTKVFQNGASNLQIQSTAPTSPLANQVTTATENDSTEDLNANEKTQ